MAASLGLTLYNLRPRRETAAVAPPARPARPERRLVWLHAPGDDDVGPMLTLARRLLAEDGLAAVLTAAAAPAGVLADLPPADTPAEVRAFLDHWRPEAIVVAAGELRPVLLHEAAERRLPVIYADGQSPRLPRDREGWYPGLMRSTLMQVGMIHARDEEAARAFRKAGAPAAAVAVSGRMEAEAPLPPVNEAERAGYARILATRPIWLALGVTLAEEAAVLAAHRAALRYSHRLLMILEPAEALRRDALVAACASEGWQVADRAQDDEPDIDCPVWLGRGRAEDEGLWLRLSPVTLLGGTLAGHGPVRDPQGPAALGSAILHGPQTGRASGFLARLAAAQGARRVARPGDLPDALTDLLSPDRAARLAQAAWVVTTEGTEATAAVMASLRRLTARA
jgi:3-deoxy-D-manno-octulosonic-acid transferase